MKSSTLIAAELLESTGLYKQIFGRQSKNNFNDTSYPFNLVSTLGEFMFLLMQGSVPNPPEFFKNVLHGDNESYNEIRSYILAFNNSTIIKNVNEARGIAYNMYKISQYSIESDILPQNIKNGCDDLLSGLYPKTTTELALNGNDLMQLGLRGEEIGKAQKSLLAKIYANIIKNDKEELTYALKNNVSEGASNMSQVTINENKLHNNQTTNMEKNANGEYIMKDISYTAIILNDRSRNKLIEAFKDRILQGYRIVAHHMTICMGRLPENQLNEIGLTVQLTVESFAMDDKVIAVGVSGYHSNNQQPYITLAVNDQNGGKPVMSNYLTNWEKILRFKVSGIITEVPYSIK